MYSLKIARTVRFAFVAVNILVIQHSVFSTLCSHPLRGKPAFVPVGPVRVKQLPCPEGGCPSIILPAEVQGVGTADSFNMRVPDDMQPGSAHTDYLQMMTVPSHVVENKPVTKVTNYKPQKPGLAFEQSPHVNEDEVSDPGDPGGDYIVGGKPVQLGEYPFLAAILRNGRFGCGGSILTPGYVLTARHCCFDVYATQDFFPMEMFEIRAGDYDLTAYEGTEQTRTASKCEIFVRPSRTETASIFRDDYAIFLLTEPFKRSSNVGPVSLPPPGVSVPVGTKCSIIGWGSTKVLKPRGKPRTTTNVPYKATVPVLHDGRCMEAYPVRFSTPSQICAGYEDGGVDACKGDSGGPLLCPVSDGSVHQFGIVSWGDGCAYPNHYGVYANVSHVRSWIYRIAGV